MSEGCEADKFLKFPATPSSARCPERSAGTQTAGRLFFGYFLLAKQKKVTSRRATPGRVVKGNSYQFNSNPFPSILDQMPVFPPASSANHRHECRTQRPSLAGKAWAQACV